MAKETPKKRSRMPQPPFSLLSSTGWYRIPRGFLDDPIFGDKPFDDSRAFLWLVERAIFLEDVIRLIEGTLVQLNRGQTAHSVRYMANAWGWDKGRVERFLNSYTKRGKIKTDSETGITRITICQYDLFSSSPNENRTPNMTRAGQSQDKPRTNRKKEKKEKNKPPLIPLEGQTQEELKGLSEKDGIWQLAILKLIERIQYQCWIAQLKLLDSGYIQAPSKFVADYCRQHFEAKIRQAILSSGYEYNGFSNEYPLPDNVIPIGKQNG